MRRAFIMCLLLLQVHAIDYENMFLSTQRYNAYSSLNSDPEKEKEAYFNALESKGGRFAKKSSIKYQAHVALEAQNGFEDHGYALVLSALKSFPKFFPKYPDIFTEGSLLYTFNALTSIDGAQVKDDIILSAYGGYAYEYTPQIIFNAKIGSSFITGSSTFVLSYGVGLKYDIKVESVLAIVNVVLIDELYIYSVGAQYAF